MMIRTVEQLERLLDREDPKLVLWKQKTPSKHSRLDSLSCLYIKLYRGSSGVESFFIDLSDFVTPKHLVMRNALVFGKKEMINLGFIMYNCYELGYYYDQPEDPPIYNFYYSKFGKDNCINDVIPISVHVDAWSGVDIHPGRLWNAINKPTEDSLVWHDYAPRVFANMEAQGIGVDREKFLEHFPDKEHLIVEGRVYTHYNLFTKTGRPSNAFGGINFAALRKDTGEREAFVPTNGTFVNVDFSSYHIMLLKGYLGETNVGNPHLEFAKHYYRNRENWEVPITPEEYEAGKSKTFSYLYGELDVVGESISFFRRVKEFARTQIHQRYLREGTLSSPSGRRFLYEDELTPNKTFNYFVQMLETETNIRYLNEMAYNVKLPVPVLYTYDSFVFDVDPDYVPTVQSELSKIFHHPFEIKVGKNLAF